MKVFAIGFTLDYERNWASEKETIKRNFKRDVLPYIEMERRLVCVENGVYCPNCYAYSEVYGICDYHDSEAVEITFHEYKLNTDSWTLRMNPMIDVFEYRDINRKYFLQHTEFARQKAKFFSWGQSLA